MADPSEAPSSDPITLLSKCPENKLENFFHSIIDGICGKVGGNMDDYSFWTLEDWWSVNNYLKDVIIKLSSDKDTFQSNIPKSTLTILSKCLTTRKLEVENSLTQQACQNDGVSLKDFDWKLKMVLASDKMGTLFQPLLELDLDLQDPVNGKKTVSIEMSKDELKNLINSLENANKALSPLIS